MALTHWWLKDLWREKEANYHTQWYLDFLLEWSPMDQCQLGKWIQVQMQFYQHLRQRKWQGLHLWWPFIIWHNLKWFSQYQTQFKVQLNWVRRTAYVQRWYGGNSFLYRSSHTRLLHSLNLQQYHISIFCNQPHNWQFHQFPVDFLWHHLPHK